MAFCCAVEPCAFRVPLAQAMGFDADELAPPAFVAGVVLLSEPHAASANVAVSARPARMPCRWSFTCCPFERFRELYGSG
jgi:hypothetical protein